MSNVYSPPRLKSWEERYRARSRAQIIRTVLMILFGLILGILVGIAMAHAEWKPQYADASPAVQDWYAHAELTPEAQKRFPFKSCCDHADVVKTKFRVGVKGQDVWEFFDPAASPPAWRVIPADIIHWGEAAPDGQPTLFRMGTGGGLTCFYPGESGN